MCVHLHAEPSGRALFLGWFLELPAEAQDALLARIELLEREGWALGPPVVRGEGDEPRELVLRHRGLELCVPFFFHGRSCAVLSHGRLEGRDPGWRDARWVLHRRAAHRRSPARLTFELALETPGGARRTRSATRILRHLLGEAPARVQGLARAREALELSLAFARGRHAAGLERDDLAVRLGVAAGALAELEEGDAHALSLGLLRRVADELGLGLAVRWGAAQRAPAPLLPERAGSEAATTAVAHAG